MGLAHVFGTRKGFNRESRVVLIMRRNDMNKGKENDESATQRIEAID